MGRELTEAEIEESIAFGYAANAAAGHVSPRDPVADRDLEAALRGEITVDEAVERAHRRAVGSETP